MTVSSSETEEEGHRHRGDATWRRRQRWEGGGHQPRDAWSPQELGDAGGTVPGPHLCQGEGSWVDKLSTVHVTSPGTLTAVLRKETVKHAGSQREGDLGFPILSLHIGVLWTPRLVYKLGTRYPPMEASRLLLEHCPRIKPTFPLCPLPTRVLLGVRSVCRERVLDPVLHSPLGPERWPQGPLNCLLPQARDRHGHHTQPCSRADPTGGGVPANQS